MAEVGRDGQHWRTGATADIEWIYSATENGVTITSAIPPVFDDYATIVLPHNAEQGQPRHDEAVIGVLAEYSRDQPWWLGYLDRGTSDIIFPEAPKVRLYAEWPYVLVQAGPEQALSWRQSGAGSGYSSCMPELMFPADRSWLVSTLWDDDWTCLGGSVSFVERFVNHCDLRSRTRRVGLDQDATPPGHQSR
jgi:hypothetical protein